MWHYLYNYSALKKKKIRLLATTWVNLEDRLSKGRHKKTNLKKVKLTETENKMVVTRGSGKRVYREKEDVNQWYKISVT